jgi:hypothetical protein
MCKFKPHSWRGVLDTTLCDNVCQWLVTGQWFSASTLVSSTNKHDRHDITEILLKVALTTINQPETGQTLKLTEYKCSQINIIKTLPIINPHLL